MSASSVQCPGCGKELSAPGLKHHYRQVLPNSRCAKIYRESLAYLPPPLEPDSPTLGPQRRDSDSAPFDEGVSMFLEDDDDDFRDMPELLSDSDSDDEDPDESDSDDEEEPASWEPPPAPRPPTPEPEFRSPSPEIPRQIPPAAAPGLSPQPEPAPDSTPPPPAPEERFLKQPHITKFGGAAGAPLADRQEVPVYEQYQSALSDSGDNPWAPFKSQIDWQIAQWAKVRGSTSTAFTELLSINGVSPSSKYFMFEQGLMLTERSLRPWDFRTRTLGSSIKSSTPRFPVGAQCSNDRKLLLAERHLMSTSAP
jgi:hypothetical protein